MTVGDYVRTKDGIILKIKDIEDIYTTDNIYIGMSLYDNEGHFVNDVEIIKSSPNIIDLIEVGDYVNGKEVTNYFYVGKQRVLVLDYEEMGLDESENYIPQLAIKSIVTKEQLSSIEYKITEN